MKKILVVEDEVVIALAASLTLEEAGFQVIAAADGESGLAKARRDCPDAIVTDFMMPRMDGVAMVRALRNEGCKVPVVMATAIAEDRLPLAVDERQHFYAAFLNKPYTDDDLLAIVQRVLPA